MYEVNESNNYKMGSIIKARRIDMGFTQNFMAKCVNCSIGYYKNLENSKQIIDPSNSEKLKSIIELLELNINEVLEAYYHDIKLDSIKGVL